MEKTLLLIKPDVVAQNKTGEILARVEKEGFAILGLKHGPIIVCCLGRENAVRYLREIVGDTDPSEAKPGTLRAIYGADMHRNGVHVASPDENPSREVHFFFSAHELCS
jgi:nucleoside-diphosphate kinase